MFKEAIVCFLFRIPLTLALGVISEVCRLSIKHGDLISSEKLILITEKEQGKASYAPLNKQLSYGQGQARKQQENAQQCEAPKCHTIIVCKAVQQDVCLKRLSESTLHCFAFHSEAIWWLKEMLSMIWNKIYLSDSLSVCACLILVWMSLVFDCSAY